jgi:hypothetical protein
MKKLFVAWIICIGFCAAGGFAADLPPATQPSPADVTQPLVAPPQLRDPTEADSSLKQALDSIRAPGANGRSLSVPQVVNRGMVLVSGKPPEALIEVQGAGLFFVHEGSVVTAGSSDQNVVMRIVRLSADGIEIEIASQKQRLIVR